MKVAAGLILAGLVVLIALTGISDRPRTPSQEVAHPWFVGLQIGLLLVTAAAVYLVLVARGGLRNRAIEDKVLAPLRKLYPGDRQGGGDGSP